MPVPARRHALQALGGLLAVTLVPAARATPEAMRDAMRAFAPGAVPREGRVTLDIAPLVENGNAVPVTISVDAPVRVQRIGLYTERNPLPDVVQFELGPRVARPVVGTRIRLATSQQIVALALLTDGSCWMSKVDVVVTLAACIEG
jgi:sulfur-oxidizing protein SoxY